VALLQLFSGNRLDVQVAALPAAQDLVVDLEAKRGKGFLPGWSHPLILASY